ncbi:phosphatase PAP2 family protein [Streptococcus uberis]|uniref:phosphatase PAP2 family protein n=1 Tax=Streptococcus uberis TaxID=1349 RepID=UPI003D6B60D8
MVNRGDDWHIQHRKSSHHNPTSHLTDTHLSPVKQALFLMTFYFGTSALALVLKLVIHRSRPLYQLLPDSSFSFPSGHSVCAVLLLLMVLFLLKEKPTFLSLSIRCVTFIFTLLVLLSRVYLRDHFPTDILASLSLDFSSYYLLLAFIG